MTAEHADAWTRTSRIIKARPEELYEAFMDPAALIAWLPPADMTGEVHEFDARVRNLSTRMRHRAHEFSVAFAPPVTGSLAA
jgi:uncharacterized protein YndB with AHSA1/START domain